MQPIVIYSKRLYRISFTSGVPRMGVRIQYAKVIVVVLVFLGVNVLSVAADTIIEEYLGVESRHQTYCEPSVEIRVENLEFEFGSISTEEGPFATIELHNEGFTNVVGVASLPKIRYMVEMPQGADPSIVIESDNWESTSLQELSLPTRIVPVQPSLVKTTDAKAEFVIDNDYYDTDEFLPQNIVKIIEVGEIRSRRFALIEISPVQYNPSSGCLKILAGCDIEIQLPGSNLKVTSEKIKRYTSPTFDKIWKTLFVNYDDFNIGSSPIQGNDESYLIIVHDDFYEDILPLASLKESEGYESFVTRTSEIPGGITKEYIKNYIEDAYYNWEIPPSYVLLVGDTEYIPTFTGIETETASDLYYVTITPEDYFPDILIGRFPASQESHVIAMVNKTVTFDQINISNEDFLTKISFMASDDHYLVTEETHNNVIETYLSSNYYTCDRLYSHTQSATTQQVADAFNDGRFLGVFSGHGGTDCWLDGPYFDQSNINSLMNHGMYPFICSHACVTGQFTENECFGETWLRTSEKGGLAFWGSSANTFWEEDDILEKKMFSAWWDNNIGSIGGMTDLGLYQLYLHYGGEVNSKYYFEAYNLLGDPSVILWRSGPHIHISEIKGGLGVSAVIKSVGTEFVTDIEWSVSIEGGILGLINTKSTGSIPLLPAGEEVKVKSDLIFGLGSGEITVKANEKERKAKCFVIGPFIIGVSLDNY